jgi:hypothetical protein
MSLSLTNMYETILPAPLINKALGELVDSVAAPVHDITFYVNAVHCC